MGVVAAKKAGSALGIGRIARLETCTEPTVVIDGEEPTCESIQDL